jgi:hypothetical protein
VLDDCLFLLINLLLNNFFDLYKTEIIFIYIHYKLRLYPYFFQVFFCLIAQNFQYYSIISIRIILNTIILFQMFISQQNRGVQIAKITISSVYIENYFNFIIYHIFSYKFSNNHYVEYALALKY